MPITSIELTVAQRIIENHENMEHGEATKANKALIATLNDAEALETLKGLMAGPRNQIRHPVHGTTDLWRIAVENFRKRVSTDNAALSGIEVNGRMLLYKQLAHAYEMGLLLVEGQKITDESNVADTRRTYPELANLLYNHHMDDEKGKLEKGTAPNIWAYVTKLFYGKWIETDKLTTAAQRKLEKKLKLAEDRLRSFEIHPDGKFEEKTIFHVWQHDRSAEKYANVFRYLHTQKVAPADVADFIDNFAHQTYGNRLTGIEAKDRWDNRTQPTPKKLNDKTAQKREKQKAAYIARAESMDNGDVMEMAKPKKLPDAVQFGSAIFRVLGDNMVIVGYDAWEPEAYEKHLLARGKKMIDEENQIMEKQKQYEADQHNALLDVNTDLTNRLFAQHGDDIKMLIDAGIKPQAITEKLIEVIKGMAVVQPSTGHLEQFAVADPA